MGFMDAAKGAAVGAVTGGVAGAVKGGAEAYIESKKAKLQNSTIGKIGSTVMDMSSGNDMSGVSPQDITTGGGNAFSPDMKAVNDLSGGSVETPEKESNWKKLGRLSADLVVPDGSGKGGAVKPMELNQAPQITQMPEQPTQRQNMQASQAPAEQMQLRNFSDYLNDAKMRG